MSESGRKASHVAFAASRLRGCFLKAPDPDSPTSISAPKARPAPKKIPGSSGKYLVCLAQVTDSSKKNMRESQHSQPFWDPTKPSPAQFSAVVCRNNVELLEPCIRIAVGELATARRSMSCSAISDLSAAYTSRL